MRDKPPLRSKALRADDLIWDGITLVMMLSIAFFVYWWVAVK